MVGAEDALHAFYDLDRQPTSYDVVHFLLAAEAAREEAGRSRLVVVVVPRSAREARVVERFRELRGSGGSAQGEDWMRAQVVAAVPEMLPSVCGVLQAPDREWADRLHASLDPAQVYPPRYDVRVWEPVHHLRRLAEAMDAGFDARRLCASPVARSAVARWVGGGPYVTVTLRRSSTSPVRNSDEEAWRSFARLVLSAGLDVVLVDDFEAPPLEWDLVDGRRVRVFGAAEWNVQARLALYEGARLNGLVNNGPAALAMFAREGPPTFVAKMMVPGVPETSPAYFQEAGIRTDGSYPPGHPFATMVWSPDDARALQACWEAHREAATG